MIDLKKLNARIVSIGKRSTTLRADIQLAGLDAVQSIGENAGDTVFLTRLADQIGQGANRASFVTWIEENTFARRKPAKDGVKDTFVVNGKSYVFALEKGWQDVDLNAQREVQAGIDWFAAAREAEKPELDLAAVIKKLQSVEKAVEKASEEGRLKQADEVNALLQQVHALIA